MDFDITWGKPSEAQTAALDHAIRYAGPALRRINRPRPGEEWTPPITEWHIAEMMCMAEGSLWYTQACGWAEGKNYPAKGADRIWQIAGKAIQAVVKHGYQNERWWNPEEIWKEPMARATAVLSIIEITRLTRLLRGTLSINSAFFEILPYLVEPRLKVESVLKLLGGDEHSASYALAEVLALYDPGFKKDLNVTKRAVRQKVYEKYEPTICIHPECENLVAPKGIKPREGHYKNYRATGACQQGHNSYYCIKCKAPHSFVSKVGQTHYPEHYHHDWDGLDESGEKWVPRG